MYKILSILVLALFLLSIISPITIVNASTRTIDGNPSDWTGTPPATDNTYTYDTTAGEWIWKDAVGDERTDFASPDTRVDITEFRVSGNSTHLLLLVKFNDLDIVGSNGAPAIFITIDKDRTINSGQTYFALNSDTQTAGNGSANWEYQILVDLANSAVTDGGAVYGDGVQVWNGGSPLDVLDTSWNDVSTSSSMFVASTTNDVVEIAIAWSDLGITDVSDFYLRIELANVRSDGTGNAWDLSGVSDVLDCMTTTGPNTWDEVGDGYIDYYVNIHFANGEPSPPPPPSYKVYGYVVDQNGNYVSGATVEIDGATNTTNATGYFELYVSSGTYNLTVSKPGYATTKVVVSVSGDTNVGNITIWKFLVDTTTNTNDFPSGSLVYQAEELLTADGHSEDALSKLYVAWDEQYLYIGVDWAPGGSDLGLGIGIDANPSVADGYSSGTDSWGRSISFNGSYIDYEAYFWYDHTSSSIISDDFNRYLSGTWIYDYSVLNTTAMYYGPVATGHDGSTVFKVAIRWAEIVNVTNYNGTVVLAVWITGNSGSAVSALPLNPDTLTGGSNEWSDSDTIYMYASITVDQDINGVPDTGVTASSRTVFYPRLSTTLTTDKSIYNVVTGGTVSIITTLSDSYGYLIPDVNVYVTDGVTTYDTQTTDLSGQAVLSFTAPGTPGIYTYYVRFDGHAGWTSSSKTVSVVVTAPSYKVYGYVTDKDTGSGVVGATVELLDPDTLNPVVTNTTVANGYYELYTTAGTYILRVNKTASGYALYHVKVVVTGATHVDVQLMHYLIDLTTNANDFPANSFVYIAQDQLTAPRGAYHNLSRIYVAWDTEYLYIGTDFAPADWWLAFGFAIDVNPGNSSTGYGAVWASDDNAWEDCWRRKINFTTPYSIGPVYPELVGYIWYQGTDGVKAAQINRYKYESYPPVVGPSAGVNHDTPWDYGYATPGYSPVATTKDGSTLFKVAIPWTAIEFLPNIEYTGKLALVVWVAHGDTSSALSVLPNNPLVFNEQGWSEWGDNDVLYMFINTTFDSDMDYTPDDVAPSSVTSFYPSITTTVETDKDVYEVGAAATFQVKAKVKDALGNYLAAVKVELYDNNGVKIGEGITNYNTGDENAFTVTFTATAPLSKGLYNYKVKFVGDGGFLSSEKTIVINVTRSGTRIVDFNVELTLDVDGNNIVSSGDHITITFTLEGYDGGWHGLADKPVDITFNYTKHFLIDSVTEYTDSSGWISYDYTIPVMTGADVLVITINFAGDENYSSASETTALEINLGRIIDGLNNDWGTDYPRSTPGIAPRGDEIVITDPLNDIHQGATGQFSELDIKEVRITYDGLYLYFYVKYAGSLTSASELTVNVAVDATPSNPADGFSEWLYGYWFTDTRLGGFTSDGTHVDTWKWTHVMEAIPIESTVQVRALSDTVKSTGKLAVNTAEGFIEFAVPIDDLPGLDPTNGFRVWISTFGVPSQGSYVSLTGSNVIDIAGVGDTNLELLTYRDPNWGNLTWPGEDIWIDTAFYIKFSGPLTPAIPDPSPSTPPTDVSMLGIFYNGTLYPVEDFSYNASDARHVYVLVLVKGTQGRPVNVSIGGSTFTGVAGADDIAIVPVTLPPFTNGGITITASSDGTSESATITAVFPPPPMPEPSIMPLVLLGIVLAILLIYKRKK